MRLSISFLLVCGCAPEPAPTPQPVARPPVVESEEVAPPPSANHPPRVKRISYLPARPTGNDDLVVQVEAIDPDGDAIDVDYVWYVGETKLLHRTRDNLPSSEFRKGDVVHVEVVARDMEASASLAGPVVTIANIAPFFLRDPRNMGKVDGYQVEAQDPDGDPITYSVRGGPKGMSIDPKTGKLHYEGTVDEPGGDYHVAVRAEDDDKGFANWEFGIAVSAGSGAKKAPK